MWSVNISVSPCADATRIGYDERQINRIVIRMAQYFLDQNMCVIFGHDWREDGVMRAIANFAEAVAALRAETRDEDSDHSQPENREQPRMLNVVPTGGAPLSQAALDAVRISGGVLEVTPYNHVEKLKYERMRESNVAFRDQSDVVKEPAAELSALRLHITELLDPGCRICLGGTTRRKNRKLGVWEEAQLALNLGKPLYLMGGFGGASRLFGRRKNPSIDYWQSDNGLDKNDKRELFETTDVERALRIILSGIQSKRESV